MPEYVFMKGYKHNPTLRKSFNELANQTFGISFENWYEKGYWNERYEPYSFLDGDRVIANVSVNKIDLMINGEKKKAIQIGTVMTHPEHRNQGLSAKLINQVLGDYTNHCDMFYLFANHNVLEFYPKFGFSPMVEYQFTMDFTTNLIDPNRVQKLDGSNDEDLNFIYTFASQRLPVSTCFGTYSTVDLLMFYCINVFSQDIYYLQREDAIVIYKQEDNRLHVFDIISQSPIGIHDVLKQISNKETTQIVFHFTPDYKISTIKNIFTGGEVLFVKVKQGIELPKYFKHPITSQA